MGNFTELFNGCHTANDMAKFYLENAEKNAYTDFQTSMLNVRLAIEEFNEEINSIRNHSDYDRMAFRNYVQTRWSEPRYYFNENRYRDFNNNICDFYKNMQIEVMEISEAEANTWSKAHNLAMCCLYIYNDDIYNRYSDIEKIGKQLIYIYAYSCHVILHTGADSNTIRALKTYAKNNNAYVNFNDIENEDYYLRVIYEVLKKLYKSNCGEFNDSRIPVLEPVEEWVLENGETIREKKFEKYTTKSGIYKKIDNSNEYAMITLYNAQQYNDAKKDLDHFFSTYNQICENHSNDIFMPYSSRTKIRNITTNDINRIILYQYFNSKPLHINDDLVNDTSFPVVDRVKIAIGIGNTINHLHEKDIYIRTLTNDSFLLIKNHNEYIPYITGLMEAKDLAAEGTVINNAIQSFIDMGVYCAPWVKKAQRSSYDTMDWRQADIYSYGVLLSYLLFGQPVTYRTIFTLSDVAGKLSIWNTMVTDDTENESIEYCLRQILIGPPNEQRIDNFKKLLDKFTKWLQRSYNNQIMEECNDD